MYGLEKMDPFAIIQAFRKMRRLLFASNKGMASLNTLSRNISVMKLYLKNHFCLKRHTSEDQGAGCLEEFGTKGYTQDTKREIILPNMGQEPATFWAKAPSSNPQTYTTASLIAPLWHGKRVMLTQCHLHSGHPRDGNLLTDSHPARTRSCQHVLLIPRPMNKHFS